MPSEYIQELLDRGAKPLSPEEAEAWRKFGEELAEKNLQDPKFRRRAARAIATRTIVANIQGRRR